MKKERDPRINVGYTSFKEYFILFWILAAINGLHMWLYSEFLDRNMPETNLRFVVGFLMGYLAFAAVLVTGSIAIVRHISWSRPMRKLSEAVRKIAKGDFSVRIAPIRKDSKKDYIEVMFDDFNTMAQELQTVETLQTDFIANVSHEIKTPLSVIQEYAVALKKGKTTEEEREDYAETIIEATEKLSALVSNILKLNKLENQGIMPEVHTFALDEQIRQCAVTFEDLWENKNIIFNAELEEITVCYNENMLEIVWNNLLANAIKFTESGGNIFIHLKEENNMAVVSISDTGCGMDENTQKRIFDKFYQGDSSRSQEGNGLGLSMVKRIIDLVGGTITVESEPGEGTTFTVCLRI